MPRCDLDFWPLTYWPWTFTALWVSYAFKLCTKFERNRIIHSWVIDDLARFRRALFGVSLWDTADRGFSGVHGPNFTKLSKNIGRSSQHCTFVEVAEPIHCRFVAFCCWYITLHCDLDLNRPCDLDRWPLTFDLWNLQRIACDVMKLCTKFECSRAIRGRVIAISMFDLMTLNTALRVALGSGIIFIKFDFWQLIRAWIITFFGADTLSHADLHL